MASLKPRLTSYKLRLIVVLLTLITALLLAIMFWYMPNRSDVILKRALANSLRQPGVTFRLEMPGAGMRIDGQVGEGGNFQAAVTRNGSDKDRMKLLGIDGDIYLQGQDGQWLTVPSQALNMIMPVATSSLPNDMTTAGLNEATRQRMERIYGQYEFVDVVKILPDETVEGMTSRHYEVRVNKQQLQRFLKAAKREIPALNIQDSQITAIVEATLLDGTADVWIGKTDGLIRQIAYNAGRKPESTDASLSLTLLSYGDLPPITKPQSSQSLLDALRQ